ncbi:MAG: ABC transporter permease [Sphingomonadales bacterium]|jgi:lipopolysaccharide transport system permease protein
MHKATNTADIEQWSEIIEPKGKWYDLKLREVWQYRDLIQIFIRRDVVSVYKQTILGPIWFFLGPLMTVFIYTFVFGTVAKIPTDNIPAPLFYLAGTTLWNYFSNCLSGASTTFMTNAHLFGKVYFPRLVAPISLILSNLVKLGVQFLVFLAFWAWYWYDGSITPNMYVAATPLLLILMAGISLGTGIIISSYTTKYRDLSFLMPFAISVLMYATPVIYPTSALPGPYRLVAELNPIAHIIEAFRFAFTGGGVFSWWGLLYSTVFMMVTLLGGIMVFNKVERTFMDTV